MERPAFSYQRSSLKVLLAQDNGKTGRVVRAEGERVTPNRPFCAPQLTDAEVSEVARNGGYLARCELQAKRRVITPDMTAFGMSHRRHQPPAAYLVRVEWPRWQVR